MNLGQDWTCPSRVNPAPTLSNMLSTDTKEEQKARHLVHCPRSRSHTHHRRHDIGTARETKEARLQNGMPEDLRVPEELLQHIPE